MSLTRNEIEQHYRQYGGVLLRRAEKLLGSASLAQEILQEAFVRAICAAESFRNDASPFTWLYQIVTRLCLKSIRDRGIEERRLASVHQSEATPSSAESLALLRQVLAVADDREAHAAIYALVDGMTYDEIAPLLAVSRRTVGNLVERFRQRARDLVESDDSRTKAGGLA